MLIDLPARIRVTLDSNAIIDLEEGREVAPALRELIALHRSQQLTLCVSNISAGERDRGGAVIPNYANFAAKLAATDLADAELLNPPCHWDITFWDRCVFGELNDTLQPRIRDILFPAATDHFAAVPGESDLDIAKRIRKGNNELCDILAMWCHIHYGGDVFVTSDANFHKPSKKPRLIELGARNIMTPIETIQFVTRCTDPGGASLQSP